MQWLYRLFFFGRVRRMRQIQQAAALLAAGKEEEAEAMLDRSRAARWVGDLAFYHYVMGQLRLVQGDLAQAELHLHTALGLGFELPSAKLHLAVVRLRQCQLDQALALLDDVELSDDPSERTLVSEIRKAVADARAGKLNDDIRQRADRFRKKHLKGSGGQAEQALVALTDRLQNAKLSSKDREDAVLLLGELFVDAQGGTWMLGLEPRDHRVLIKGFSHSPAQAIDSLLAGETDALSLPSAP